MPSNHCYNSLQVLCDASITNNPGTNSQHRKQSNQPKQSSNPVSKGWVAFKVANQDKQDKFGFAITNSLGDTKNNRLVNYLTMDII
jgi:hypothetical protein